jgi:hypothetical protein
MINSNYNKANVRDCFLQKQSQSIIKCPCRDSKTNKHSNNILFLK